jgi:hypothetical protein
LKRSSFTKLLAAAAMGVALAGCATGPKFQEVQSRMAPLKADEGRVVFFRSNSLVGAAIQPEIKLNGDIVGASKPGGFFWADRPAGNYSVTSATEVERSLSLSLAPGETKYVRSSITFGLVVRRVQLELETPEKARAELPELTYTGAEAK